MTDYSKIVSEAWEQATEDGDTGMENRFRELTNQFTTPVTDWHAIAIEAGLVKPDSPELIDLAVNTYDADAMRRNFLEIQRWYVARRSNLARPKTYDADALLRSLLEVQPTVAKMGDLRCGYCGRAVEGIAMFGQKAHSDTCRWFRAHQAVKTHDETTRKDQTK